MKNAMTDARKIVVSEPIARKLKKLGFPQETVFGWSKEGMGGKFHVVPQDQSFWDGYYACGWESAAYTAPELGPFLVEAEKQMKGKVMNDKMVKHLIDIAKFRDEATNRAKLLIYLVENKFIVV